MAIIMTSQGRSHAFQSEGAQTVEMFSGAFCLENWEGPPILIPLSGPTIERALAPLALKVTTSLTGTYRQAHQ